MFTRRCAARHLAASIYTHAATGRVRTQATTGWNAYTLRQCMLHSTENNTGQNWTRVTAM
eukprot:839218-Lingulodinium_polyedra.AAC.1